MAQDRFPEPEEVLRQAIPDEFDEFGEPLSALERAELLTPESCAADVRNILISVASSDDLVIDEVIAEIGRRTKRRFKVATMRDILSQVKSSEIIRTNGHAVPGWISSIITNAEGDPVPMAANVLKALRGDLAWKDRLGFDEFRQQPMMLEKPPWANGHWKGPEPFTDADEARVLVWVQEQGIHARIDAVRQALSIVVDDHRFHPVREYLSELVWDGEPRLDKWLTYYLGVTPIPNYTGPVGACWMISAVARIFNPGCTAKYALILEGPQDLKKSTALEILGSPWFTDDIAELGTKDAAMQAGNAWIIELSELDSTRKADVRTIKAFLSRKVDKFRKPFGRYVVDQPRQCVIAGTINPSVPYLADETGGVRFWPVACTAIDAEALKEDRDQLWAESVVRYRNGERWYLADDDQLEAARAQQDYRYSADAWEPKVALWLAGNVLSSVTTGEILWSVFEIPAADWDRPRQTRIGIILRRLGWIPDAASKERPRPYIKPF